MQLGAFLLGVSGLFAAPMVPAAVPTTPATAPPEAPEHALVRLRELFTSSDGTLKAPKSPRFVSLTDPTLRGTRLVIGWLLPPLSAAEETRVAALVAALGQDSSGRFPAELPVGGLLTCTAALSELGGAKLLVITLTTLRRGAEKELELGVLAALARLVADGPVSGPVRRALAPLSRAVVEVHAPEPPRAVPPVHPGRGRPLSPGQKRVLPR